ncbi:MAG: hypothetical protein IT269_02255, partial [Saprospiraceae bacterium]|nr:hypothetical protein [Saprospiraceae bacterium]
MKGLFWVFFFFVGVFTHKLAATHIVGGEITYRCLGNSNYEVKLHIYRDCYTGDPWFDNPAIIGVYDAQWNLVKKLSLPWSSATNGNDTLPIVLSDPCLQIPPNVCVHRTTYTQVVNLPFKTGGYTLVYQRCCRNNLIKNLPDPLNTGISYTANISDQSLLTCNTGARFKSWPDVAICANIPINFDHSAFDADGDVLRYRLCTPLNGPDSTRSRPNPPLPGPYSELVWNNPPYSLQNLMGGVVPLKIDSITGLLTGIPSILGNFVVGVCVDEYRAGQLISTTRRDFQYNVADCGQPVAAFFTPEVVCDTLSVLFNNAGDNTANYQWYFNWPDVNGPQSTEYSPLHTFPDTGIYQIALIAEPGDPCADTLIKQIRLANRYIGADMKLPEITCDSLGVVVSGTDLSS